MAMHRSLPSNSASNALSSDEEAINNTLKDELGIIFAYAQDIAYQECALLQSAIVPEQNHLNDLPIKSAGYIYVRNESKETKETKETKKNQDRLFYVNKDKKKCMEITPAKEMMQLFYKQLKPTIQPCILNIKNNDKLKEITSITNHVHETGEPYNTALSFFDNIKYKQLKKAAEDILWGSTDINQVCVEMVRSDHFLLHKDKVIEVKDPLGRRVKGTLLQIAAMAGDFNIGKKKAEEKEGKKEEKKEEDDGLVELLAKAGELPPGEIAEQLKIVTSPEAEKENEARNKRILDAIIQFGKGILKVNNEYGGKDFEALYALLIEQLEEALTPPNEAITSGTIFDPKILYDAAKWFEQNVDRFGGWWSRASDMWWVNGFGKLQSKLSARDAHVVRAGIGSWADGEKIPRSLNNSDGSSYFFNSSSRLGQDFYLGYYGAGGGLVAYMHGPVAACASWKTYVEQKQQHCKTYAMSSAYKTELVSGNVAPRF